MSRSHRQAAPSVLLQTQASVSLLFCQAARLGGTVVSGPDDMTLMIYNAYFWESQSK
jgi:hypothetical protein